MTTLEIPPPPRNCLHRGCSREVKLTLIAGQAQCSRGHLHTFDRTKGTWRPVGT